MVKKKIQDKIVWQLVEEDFQMVAEDGLDRRLTKAELKEAIKRFNSIHDWWDDVCIVLDEICKDKGD